MRKGLSIIFIFIISLLISFNINAEEINNGINYLYTEKELDRDYLTKLYFLPSDLDNYTGNYKINYLIKDNDIEAKLVYEYGIINSCGNSLKITINGYLLYDLEFDGNIANLYSYGEYDLKKLNINFGVIQYFDYELDFNNMNPSLIPELFIDNELNKIVKTIKYEEGINESLSYYSNLAPDISRMIDISILSHDYIEDTKIIANNYDNTIPGSYYIELFAYSSDGLIYKDIFNVEIKDENEYYYCEDIYISYNQPVTKEKIFNYYINHYNKAYVLSYYIDSDYFLSSNVIGKYKYNVTLEFTGENECKYEKECYINVIDDVKPNIDAKIIDSKGDGSFIPIDELIVESGYDDIDGDITSNIIIIDNDDYLNNYNKSGNYTFTLKLTDKSGNTTVVILSYEVLINIGNKSDDYQEETEDIDDVNVLYEFDVTTSNQLTRTLFIQKLVFNGFYSADDDLTISSKYFENSGISGRYLVSVLCNDEIKYFVINVNEDSIDESYIDNSDNDSNSYFIYIVIALSFIAISGVGLVFYFVKKRKRNQN